jgi:hypothetical protein
MSKTFADLSNDILTVVKRPDLVDAIAMHAKNAILKAHSADFFKQDLYENAFNVASPAVQYSIDHKALVARFRKWKYINVIDPITLDITQPLTPIEIENFLDTYGYKKDYSFYLAGQYTQIRVSGSDQYFNFGCYVYPDTTLQSPSWIADEFPFAIVYEAARTLFKTIGFDEQSASMEKLVAEAYAEIKVQGISTTGY